MLNLYTILREVLNEEVTPEEVSDVISNKVRVLITYDDEQYHKVGQRIIEPYVLGVSKAGNSVLRAYQYNGDTARGVPKWKLFRLDRIRSWEPTEQHFNVQPNRNGWNAEDYNENGDRSMQNVLCQVSFDNGGEEYYSPNDRLNMLRRQTQNMRQSTPINILKGDEQEGPVMNNSLKDMIKRNMEITRQEKEKNGWDMNKLNFNSSDRGPIVPKDGESIEQARARRKKERDAQYNINRRNKRQDTMADRYKIRSPKKYRQNPDEEPINDTEDLDNGNV